MRSPPKARAACALCRVRSPPKARDTMQVRLFLTNICSDQDPLDEFMASAAWIPDVDWLTREMHKIKQVDAVQWLKDAIGQ